MDHARVAQKRFRLFKLDQCFDEKGVLTEDISTKKMYSSELKLVK